MRRMNKSAYTFLTVGLGSLLVACGANDQQTDETDAPLSGHIRDGLYILTAEEQGYTCETFDEQVQAGIVAAFENVDEGNRKAAVSFTANILSLGLGGVPRGFDFGGGDRARGRQALTRALSLDSEARLQGCDGTDITKIMAETLGEDGLLIATYGVDAMTVEEQILAGEQERKGR